MKKFIGTALAAAALAAGAPASAQDLGSVIANILGIGTPTYNQGYGYAAPGVVAGQQYSVYTDTYGRQFYYDQYGRQVYLNSTAQQQIAGYDAWGRPVYTNPGNFAYGGSGNYAYGGSTYGSSWDRDGDGIANSRDRWPNDPRYR